MIQISHETPLCLLEESLTFNDYNFCLLEIGYMFILYYLLKRNNENILYG